MNHTAEMAGYMEYERKEPKLLITAMIIERQEGRTSTLNMEAVCSSVTLVTSRLHRAWSGDARRDV